MRNPNKLTRAAVALATVGALGSLSAACTRPKPDCTSPRTESQPYAAAPGATSDRSTWPGIAVTTTNVPPDAYLVVGFRRVSPTNNNEAIDPWRDSNPIVPRFAGEVALSVGDSAVQFSTRYVAPNGSPTCNAPPATMFSTELVPPDTLMGTLPVWPDR